MQTELAKDEPCTCGHGLDQHLGHAQCLTKDCMCVRFVPSSWAAAQIPHTPVLRHNTMVMEADTMPDSWYVLWNVGREWFVCADIHAMEEVIADLDESAQWQVFVVSTADFAPLRWTPPQSGYLSPTEPS